MNKYVMTGPECRKVDQLAMRELGVSELQLMTRAGQVAMDTLIETWPMVRHMVVYCGPGNNGGDGYLLAAEAKKLGYEVSLFALGEPGSETARSARQYALDQGMELQLIDEKGKGRIDPDAELIVDALFGHGLTRNIAAPLSKLFETINALPVPVFALDMPSGINSDTGAVMGSAIQAQLTICFVAPKIGLLTGAGVDYAGEVVYNQLGIPDRMANLVPASFISLNDLELAELLPVARASSHKGDFGHVAVVGGQPGMPGAVILSAMAAARSGAGRTTVVSSEAHVNMIPLASPVLMTNSIGHEGEIDWPDTLSAVVLGPGLGAAAGWSRAVFEQTLNYVSKNGKAALLDADALNLLAEQPREYRDWVLTPHPLEAARLLGTSVAEIQANRPRACRQISERYGGVCVLKGAGSLIAQSSGPTAVCSLGNWGMATAGSGDVLSGIIGAYLGQGLEPYRAACAGVYTHAMAGDLAAARRSRRGMIASDMIEQLPALF